MRKRILLITPETPEIHNSRKGQFNNIIQIMMPAAMIAREETGLAGQQ